MTKDLHERWKEELEFVLDPTNGILEWILRGAIGTGKSTCAAIAECYKIWELTQLEDPAQSFGLLPGSSIVFGVFSITLRKADRAYELMRDFLDGSPYFRDSHPRLEKPDNPIRIPDRNIRVEQGSLFEHALSENMYGFTLDEANFFKKAHDSVSRLERTRAYDLYRQARRRQESRFLSHPGLTCLLSSQKTQTEFLEERIEKAKGDPSVHVTTFALWDVKDPREFYPSGKKFFVMIGDGRISSRILDEDEVSPAGYEVVEVPQEHKKAFEEDVDEALRDLAGKAVTGAGFFFARRELLHACIDRKRVHPFTKLEIDNLSTKNDVELSEFFESTKIFHTVKSRSTLIVDPDIPRFAHVDIGLTGDSLGLAIGHPTPIGLLYYDILLRVRAPEDEGEVELDGVINFLRYLRNLGMSFRSVTYDAYQSKHSIQRLEKFQFCAGKLSIGLEEYKELRRLMHAGAVSYYFYQPFLREAAELLKDPSGGDPDHPKGGSNDVTDGAAGVAVGVSKSVIKQRVVQQRRGRRMFPVVGLGRISRERTSR